MHLKKKTHKQVYTCKGASVMHSGWAGDLTCTKFFTQTLDGKHENFKTVSVSSLQPVTSMTKGSKGCLSVFGSKFIDLDAQKHMHLQNTRLQIVRVVVARVTGTPVVVMIVVCGDGDVLECIQNIFNWLVVWNFFYFPIYWE